MAKKRKKLTREEMIAIINETTKEKNKLFGYRITSRFEKMLNELSEYFGIPKNQILNQALLNYYNETKKDKN